MSEKIIDLSAVREKRALETPSDRSHIELINPLRVARRIMKTEDYRLTQIEIAAMVLALDCAFDVLSGLNRKKRINKGDLWFASEALQSPCTTMKRFPNGCEF